MCDLRGLSHRHPACLRFRIDCVDALSRAIGVNGVAAGNAVRSTAIQGGVRRSVRLPSSQRGEPIGRDGGGYQATGVAIAYDRCVLVGSRRDGRKRYASHALGRSNRCRVADSGAGSRRTTMNTRGIGNGRRSRAHNGAVDTAVHNSRQSRGDCSAAARISGAARVRSRSSRRGGKRSQHGDRSESENKQVQTNDLARSTDNPNTLAHIRTRAVSRRSETPPTPILRGGDTSCRDAIDTAPHS